MQCCAVFLLSQTLSISMTFSNFWRRSVGSPLSLNSRVKLCPLHFLTMQNLQISIAMANEPPSSSSTAYQYTPAPSPQPTIFFGDIAAAPTWVLPSSHPFSPPSSPLAIINVPATVAPSSTDPPKSNESSRKRAESNGGRDKHLPPETKQPSQDPSPQTDVGPSIAAGEEMSRESSDVQSAQQDIVSSTIQGPMNQVVGMVQLGVVRWCLRAGLQLWQPLRPHCQYPVVLVGLWPK